MELLQSLVELVDLNRVEVQLVEREGDLLVREEPGLLPVPHERFRVLVIEHEAPCLARLPLPHFDHPRPPF